MIKCKTQKYVCSAKEETLSHKRRNPTPIEKVERPLFQRGAEQVQSHPERAAQECILNRGATMRRGRR